MDIIHKTLLEGMALYGFSSHPSSPDQGYLDDLVKAGYAKLRHREPILPGGPLPNSSYEITELGRSWLRSNSVSN